VEFEDVPVLIEVGTKEYKKLASLFRQKRQRGEEVCLILWRNAFKMQCNLSGQKIGPRNVAGASKVHARSVAQIIY
jgi:hypothetical protein